MQGRLSPASSGRLQSFPWVNWEREFKAAAEIGFSCIEWLVDRERLRDNPMLAEAGQARIRELSREFAIDIPSICVHAFVTEGFIEDMPSAMDILQQTVEAMPTIGARRLVIPALEHASMRRPANKSAIRDMINATLPALDRANVVILLECDLGAGECAEFVDIYDGRVGICYDLGNGRNFGFDPVESLKVLGNKVSEIHFKDRDRSGSSVALGSGLVEFEAIAKCPVFERDDVVCILETPAGDDWRRAADANLSFVRDLFAVGVSHDR